MHTNLKKGLRRAAGLFTLTATAAALVLGFLAQPVAAKPVEGQLLQSRDWGSDVHIKGENHAIQTALFTLQLQDKSQLTMYCIDLKTDAQSGTTYVEDKWSNYPGEGKFKAQPEKVNWILHNSYPSVNLALLQDLAGIDTLSKKDAIAGTQAAIWYFSNGGELTDDNNAVVKALYTFLTGPANIGIKSEPKASLTIDPDTATGKAGDKIGPFTVTSNATSVPLQFTGDGGATLVDENDNVVTTATNGSKLYVKVPADAKDGQATIDATVNTTVETGRLFLGKNHKKTQTLITAKTTQTKVSDSVCAKWTATPVTPTTPVPSTPVQTTPVAHTPSQPTLPVTGAQAGLFAVLGVVLVGGGAALFITTRRRKNAAKAAS